MPAPARCTTASMPSRPPASIVPAFGSHATASPGAVSRTPRTTRTTRWPAAPRASTSAVPMRPDEPVIATSMTLSFHEYGYGRHDRVGAVQQSCLERQGALVVKELRRPGRHELRDDHGDHLVGRLLVELVEVLDHRPRQLTVGRVDRVELDRDVVLVPI